MVIPELSWETAQAAPHPERAWLLRPEKETEPLFRKCADGATKINLDNHCIRIEYETLRSRLGYDLGHPLPSEIKRQFELDMFQKYDPVGYASWLGRRKGA